MKWVAINLAGCFAVSIPLSYLFEATATHLVLFFSGAVLGGFSTICAFEFHLSRART